MTVVQTIIEGAYNRCSSNDPGKLAQDTELIIHLNRVYQRVWALIARARPDEFQQASSVPMGGAPAQGALPADIIDVVAVWTALGAQVYLIPATERLRSWHMAPAVYRQGLVLFSRNQGGDPVAGDTLTVDVLLPPLDLVLTSSPIDSRWPIRHVQLLVDYLAAYLDVKDAGRDPAAHAKLLGELQQDVSAFAAEYQLAPEAVSWIHGDVARQAKVPA